MKSSPLAAALVALAAVCPALAPPAQARPAPPRDPLFGIMGSSDAWSVSRDEAGCYVMSPWRLRTSRMALGLHPKFGAGLYAVGFATSVPDDNRTTPVVVRTEAGDSPGVGTLVAPELLFVSLAPEELSRDLAELSRAGVLWVSVRGTWVSHSGKSPAEAVEIYHKECAGWVPPPPSQATHGAGAD